MHFLKNFDKLLCNQIHYAAITTYNLLSLLLTKAMTFSYLWAMEQIMC